MTDVFLKIVSMSITASYVALVVMGIRLLLKKAPKIFSYLLWTVVLFRLLSPFSFESIVSLMPNDTNAISKNIVTVQNFAMHHAVEVIDQNRTESIDTSFVSETPVTRNAIKFLFQMAMPIWILGIFVLLCYSMFSYFILKKSLSIATRVSDNICETDRIKVPFVLGLINPKIYLPVGLKDQERDYILKHEKMHIKRRDYIIKPLAFIALFIHWFNPIIWFSFRLMIKDMEMSCDESVVRQSNEDIRRGYSESLLSMSMKQSGLILPLAFGEHNTKDRINNVIHYKRPTFWMMMITIVVVIAVGAVLMANPKSEINSENSFTKAIYLYRTEFIGNSSKVSHMVQKLPISEALSYDGIQLYTKEVPYMLDVNYKTTPSMRAYYSESIHETIFEQNAILLFSLIKNADAVNFIISDGEHNASIQRTREWAEKSMKRDLWESATTIEQFTDLYEDIQQLKYEN